MAATKKHAHEKIVNEVTTLLTWKAPSRPFKQHDPSYYRTILLLAAVVEAVLFFFTQFEFMFLVVSLVFLMFVLGSTPPHKFTYKISNQGITVEDHFFLWEELYDFYFKEKNDMQILHIGTRALIPGELIIPLGDEVSEEKVKDVILNFLPFREYVKPTSLENASNWLAKTFPLEEKAPAKKKKS